ncbi:MAG: DUF4258 domain-containing protein [SAR324 cluster bacterium]|nr:DUF4258 domain-containing protein [SAR324 cluster bacterium]
MKNIELQISEAFRKILFTPHALYYLNSPNRLILRKEVEEVTNKRDIIENYPEDARGHSSLMMARVTTEQVIHIVCAPKQEYLAVISTYLPNLDKWEVDLKIRKRG